MLLCSLFISALTLLGSALALPWLIGRLPADYFIQKPPPPPPLVRIARNAFGGVLLLAGIAMLVLPGQGLLTIFIALCLMEFPKKEALLKRLLRSASLRACIDWLRARRNAGPIQWP